MKHWLTYLVCFWFCLSVRAAAAQHNFLNLGKGSGLPNSTVKCFAEDPDGYLWIGTFDGLARYDGHSFEVVQPGHVEAVLACDSGLYVGKVGGLEYLTFADWKVQSCGWTDATGGEHHLDGSITTLVAIGRQVLALDTGGHVWVSSGASRSRFSTLSTECLALCRYDATSLLMLTSEKLLLYDLSHRAVVAEGKHGIQGPSGKNIYYSTVLDMIVVGQGIGYGSYAFRRHGDRIVALDCSSVLPVSVKAVTDYGHAMYVATDGEGVYCFESAGHSKLGCGIQEAGRYTPFEGLAGFAVHSLYADSSGNLWIGTYRNGISILSPRLDAFHSYSVANGELTYNTVTALYAHHGIIYAGTDGGGLNIVDTRQHVTRVLNAANSALPADNVLGVAFDGEQLWLGLYDHGLYRFDPVKETVRHIDLDALGAPQITDVLWKLWYDGRGYIVAEGAQMNVIAATGTPQLVDTAPVTNPEDSLLLLASHIPELRGYDLLCACQDTDGTLYYGTTTGIVRVQSEGVRPTRRHDSVWIDRLLVLTDSTSHFIGTRQGSEIRLSHDQNHFIIHFSVPRISPPDDSRFRFRLEGLDPEWRETDGTRELTYTALSPGRYILHIVCDTADGGWSSVESTLTILILPPWYSTWWAYGAAALLLICVVLAIWRFFISRKQMRHLTDITQKLRTQVKQMQHRAEIVEGFGSTTSSTLSEEDRQFLLRIQTLINENLLNPQLSVDYLARALGMSVSSLYKKARSVTGHGAADMIVDARISHAVEQMRAGQTNMTLIAERCGFNDIRAFRTAFKSRMGMTPKQYAMQL